jgi:hypothetical protein
MTGVQYDLLWNHLWIGANRLPGWEWPNIPGLLYETDTLAPSGARAWTDSADLKPGDRLHDGKLHGVFTNEQHWALIEYCELERSRDINRHRLLLLALREIVEEYKIFPRFERENGPFKQHQARLLNLSTWARQWRTVFAKEPLLWRLLAPDETTAGIEAGKARAGMLHDLLSALDASSTRVAADERELTRMRNESEKSARTGKSAKRRFIWERSFRLWRELGKPVGYSEDGPMMRFLRVIHEALDIPAPRGSSVRQAIEDFRREAMTPP